MLSWMREKAPIIMAVAIAAFIGTTIYFSVTSGSGGMTGGKEIGKVGKEKVSEAEFYSIYRNYSNNIQDQNEHKGLAKKVWEAVANERAFLTSIKDMKLGGTDQEVYDHILNYPHSSFSTMFRDPQTGIFDTAKYRAQIVSPEFLSDPAIAKHMKALEAETKERLVPGNKLNFILTVGKNPSKSEIEVEYRRRNEKIEFEYLTATSDSIALDSNDVTTAKIEKYYNDNKAKFDGGVRAAVKYIKIALKPGKEDEAEVIKDLQSVKRTILKSAIGAKRDETFAEEVNYESDSEQSKQYGGMFGTLSKGSTRYPHVEDAVLSLNVGDVSEPVKVENDYHIFYVTGKTDSSVTVKHIMKNIVLSPLTLSNARKVVKELVNSANVSSFEELVAKNENAVLDTTNFFEKGGYPEGLPFLSGLGKLAFDDSLKAVAEYEEEDVFYIVQPFKRVKEGILPLVDVNGEIVAAVEKEVKAEKAKAAIGEALKKVTDSLTLDSIAAKDPVLSYAKTQSVSRVDLMRTLNGLKIVSTAFASKDSVWSDAFEIESGYATVKPLSKTLITEVPESAYTDKEMIAQMKGAVLQNANNEWLNAYKEKVGVEENISKFFY